jgi:twinkle protein
MRVAWSSTVITVRGANTRMISEKHRRGIEARSLSLETAVAMGAYSAKRFWDSSKEETRFEPDIEGDVLCLPLIEHDEEVNTKYRWSQDGERRFMQRKGAQKTVYNANVLLKEESIAELAAGTADLIWTEGEFDCWASIESGYAHSISVPDGAPPARDKNGKLIEVPDNAKDIDPEDDDKFSFMARLMPYLQRVKTHIIAVDGDEPGQRLAKELVRRLGAARCRWVQYPNDHVVPVKGKRGELRAPKDLNEVKQYLGVEAVKFMLDNSKEWPIKHLYRLSDYPEQDLPTMCEPGISRELDEMMKIYEGQFIVGTGVPNIGKSRFFNQLFVQMAKVHKWPITMFSGESDVKPFLARDLKTMFLAKQPKDWSREDNQRATAFVERYFTFIDYDPMTSEGQIDLDTVLEMAATAVFRYGTKLLAIDPWNEMEHVRPHGQTLTEYVGNSIRKIKRFGKSYGCAVCVVAHPAKLLDTTTTPGLYHISDSAHWANKADLGVVLDVGSFTDEDGKNKKVDPEDSLRDVYIKKVRFKTIAGMTGVVPVALDPKTGVFGPAAAAPF